MHPFLSGILSILRPGDEGRSADWKAQVQLYRAFSLMGAVLVPSLSVLYKLSNPELVSPAWCYYGLSGLLVGLFAASYVFGPVRRYYVGLMWGVMSLQMIWTTGVAVANRFSSEHALAVLLTYASIGVVIELGTRSFQPIVWFLAFGFVLTVGGFYLTPAPQSGPLVLLGIMAVAALTIGFSLQGRLSIRKQLTDRESQLKAQRRKLESLYEATGRLLSAGSRERLREQVEKVLREVFGYPVVFVQFVDEKGALPRWVQPTINGGDGLAPDLIPLRNTVAARALRVGKTVVDDESDSGRRPPLAATPIGEKGVLGVGLGDEEYGFDPFDLRLLEMLTTYAEVSINRLEYQKQLVEAKENAEEASRLKSAMLANMSHEIRTPLTSIIGFAEAIGTEATELELSSDSPIGTHAELIEQGGKRLLDTLNGVLNLSKLEAGQMELSEERVDLAANVQQTAEELRPMAEEKTISLQRATEPACAQADQGGVQIILQNLVSNAIKYTEKGGTVRIRTYLEEEQAVLEVEDTGIGMEPSLVDDLFDPFRQASQGLNREYEGTGVGLAITKKATERMDGSIEVESEKGTGSRFTVRLPRARKNELAKRDDGENRVVSEPA